MTTRLTSANGLLDAYNQTEVDAAAAAAVAASAIAAGVATRINDGNTGTAKTIDWSTGGAHKAVLTGDCTFTFTPPAGARGGLVLELAQDATGTRVVTWPAAVHWPDGAAPTLTDTVNKVDVFEFYYNGTTYFGRTFGLKYTA
jgi:hypothetical protein